MVALAEAEPTLFDALLNKLSLDRNELLQSVFREPNRAADRQTGMKISDEFRELLAQSLRHARDYGRREIESTDILFGLFADTRGSIVKLFRKRGLEQATVLVEVENLISQ